MASEENGGHEPAGIQPDTSLQTSKGEGSASFLRAARAGNLDKVLELLRSGTDINTCNANGLNALHLASKEGHHEVVRELLKRKAQVDAATKKGNTALHIASLAGQSLIVTILVENQANVNVQSLNGFTPLYMAAQENHEEVVRYLLAHGANQALSTEDGFTPLAVALQQGHDRVVAILLENDTRGKVRLPALHIAAKKDDTKAATLLLQNEHNADVTSKSGFTPLHIAAHYGNENVAQLLLEKGANVNYQARHNISPLHVATKWGRVNMVNLLLANGAIIDSRTRDLLTPLHCAARSGHDPVVDLLLEKGAPISAKTKNGLAPLHMAAQGDHVDSARILLYHRAPVDDVTVDYLTPLHVAAHCGHVRVAKLLLDRNADPNARALNGFTPLHIACKKNRIKVVELLLKYHASIEATTESGLSPLHVAAFMGAINIVIYLLQQNANPDVATIRGETPLHLAARANQTDIVRVLLRNGAKVDAQARELQTPLHIASRLGNTDIVVLLLQAGANPNAATRDQYTPLHIAAKEGQEEVAAILLDHNADKHVLTKKGFTPLHLASKYGNVEVARLLLERGTPVDIEGKNQVTPLHVAAHYNNDKVALLLLENGASATAAAKNGYTPLHIAAKKNQMDIAGTLLAYKAEPNAKSRAGFTPLHLASQEGHREMAALLIENGADVGAKANNGLTAMHLCAQEDRVPVAEELVKHNSDVNAQTNAGYTPLHVACHFGQLNMVRFLVEHGARVGETTRASYTPLHQAAQQGHNNCVRYLLENGASPNAQTATGQTPLSIAQRLGYVSVVETLKTVTETTVITETTTVTEERYKPQNPEGMNETMFSESEDEIDDHHAAQVAHAKDFSDNLTAGLQDSTGVHLIHTGEQVPEQLLSRTSELEHATTATVHDGGDLEAVIRRAQMHPVSTAVPDNTMIESTAPDNVPLGLPVTQPSKLQHKTFLISFLVDARGGAMRGCRHSGVRIIIPPRKAAQPVRVTCRYLRKDKLAHPPPLSEGEELASRILEMAPAGAKFLGPVILEVPHFASLRDREREIVILRSDDGQHWKEHQLEATEDAVQEVLNESFDAEELAALDDLHTPRITRILTNDFPMYFAVVTRVRQEVHCVGPEGGVIMSSVVPRVQAIFPDGSLTKTIKVSLQAQPVPQEMVTRLHGNRVAVSPIVTVEPRRRKFHKPITLCIPLPQSSNKGMLTQYSGQPGQEPPTLRLLCSITGGSAPAQWEDITGTTQLTFTGDEVSFTTTVSARFWLMDCQTPRDAARMAQEVYNEAISIPYMAKFCVFARRTFPVEGQLRVFCMTDDKEDKTLEKQEHFKQIAKSRDVEVLKGRHQFLEFAGNLVPVTKSGDQLSLYFLPFQENRLAFMVKTRNKDEAEAATEGRIAFMREPKIRSESLPPQAPICTLTISLPEYTGEAPAVSVPQRDTTPFEKKYHGALDKEVSEWVHPNVLKQVGPDWQRLARALELPHRDIQYIRQNYPGQELPNVLRIWIHLKKTDANPEELDMALRRIGRDDIPRGIAHGEPEDLSTYSSASPAGSRKDVSKVEPPPSLLSKTPPVKIEEAVIEQVPKEIGYASTAEPSHPRYEEPEPLVTHAEPIPEEEEEEEVPVSEVRTVVRTERHVHDSQDGPVVEEKTITTTYEDDVAVNEHVVVSTVPLNDEEMKRWQELNAADLEDLESPQAGELPETPEGAEVHTEKHIEDDGTVVTTTVTTSHYSSEEPADHTSVHSQEEEDGEIGPLQASGATDSSAESGTTQKKESAEEGFTNEDGSVVVSKKMTRVVTTTRTTLPGEGDSAGSGSPTESMGSVRDRIAIFESIANQKEQLGSEDGSQHLPVEIIVTPVTPTPRQDEEEDDNLPHSEDDDKAHEKEPKEKHEGAPGSQSESDGSDDDDADDGKPRKPRKVRRTTDKITKTSYHIKKEGREGFDGNEGDEGETTGYNVPSVTIEQPHDLEHEDDYQKTTVTTVTTSMREVPEDRESETREDLESETESIGEDGQPIKRRKVRRITETVTETSYHVKKEGKGDEEAGHPHQTGELPEQDDGRSLETEHADEGEHVEHLSPPASPVPLHEHVEDERTTFVHDDELKAASEPREEYSGSEVESINSDGQPVRRKKVRHTRETITSTSYQVKKEGKEDENTETAHETEALLGRDGEGALEQVHVVEGDHVEHLSPPASPVPLHEHIEDEKTTFVHDDELGGAHDQEEDYSGSEVESINSDGQPIRRKKVRHTRETITSTSYHVKKEGKQSDLEQPSEQDLREHRERPQSADEIDETVKATATATPNVLADDDRHQADLLETGYEKKEVSEEEMETIEPSEADYEDTSKLAQLRTSPTETKQQKLPTEGMTDSFYAVSDESEVEEVKLAEIRTTSSDDFSPVKHTAGEYEQPAKEYEDASESAEIRHSDSRDLMTTSVYAESDEGASEGTKFAEIRKSPSDEELEHHKKVAGTVDTEPHREASPELSEKFGDIAKTAGMVAGGVIAAPFALAALGAKGIYDKLTDQDTTDDTTADTYEHHERYEQTHRESPIDEHHVLRESPLPETAVEEHAYPQEEHHEHFEEAEHHELLKESPQPESPIDDREQKHPEEAVVYEEHHEHFEETHRESPADEHHLLRESPLPEAAVEEHAYPQEEHQEHAYPQEEPHEHFEEAEHHELLKESPQPASPIDDREHTHPEETVGHEEHHEHFEETHRESPADEHHLLRESPLPEAAVEEHAYPQEEPHGHFEEAEHHELLKESPQPESPIDDREHTHPEETVGHEEHHEHFEETHRESPADEHHLLRESPLPEAAVEEHAYPQEKHHEHFEEAEHHELLKESPQPESTVDDREHTHPEETVGHEEHHEQFEETHRESPANEHHLLRESPLPEAAVEEHAYPQEEHQEHAYPQEEHHEHFEEAEHHELLKESPQPESSIDDREQTHPEEAVVYEEHHEHFEETHRESPADEHHLLRESPLPEAAVEEHAYPQEEHQEHAYPQEEHHEHFEEAEHHELLKESPQPESPIDDREQTHPEEAVVCEEHHEHFEETHRESPADEHHLLRESPLPEAAVEEHAYPQEEHQEHAYPQEEHHEHFEEAEHHELLKESPQPESPIDDREQTHPEEAVVYEEHHEHFEETHRESPADEHHLLRESPLPEAAVEEHAYSQEEHHEHFEEAEHHELLKESPQPESPVDDREHTHSEETVVHEEHHTQYEETHREEAGEHEPEEKSFGDKLTGFAKKAGLVAGGVIAAPIALAALGAKEAYDTLKQKQTEDDLEEHYEQESSQSQYASEHTEHFEVTQQESPVDEHHFVPESPQAESAIAAERQFMHEPEQRDHEQFEDILQKSQIEEHDLVKESSQPESSIVVEHELVPEPGHFEHYEHYEETHQKSPVDEHHFVPESPQAESPIAAERQFMHEPEERDHEQFEDILQKSQIEEHDLVKESSQPESPIVAELELVPEPGHLEHYEHYEETQQKSPVDEHHFVPESPQAESPIAAERQFMHEPEERDHEQFEDILQKSQIEEHEYVKKSSQPESPIVAEHERVPEPGHLEHYEHYEHYEETQQKSPVDEHHFVPESPQAESPIAAERQFMHEPEERNHEQVEDILQKSQIEENDLVKESSLPESPIVAEHELVPEPGHLEHYEHYEETQQKSPVDEHHFVPESPQAKSPIAAERQFMHEPEERDHEQFEDILQKSQIEEHEYVKKSSQPESPIVAEHERVPEPGHLEHYEHYEHYEETQQKSPVDEHHFVPESPQAESPIAAERQFMHEPEERNHEQVEDILQKSQIEENDLVKESSLPESPIVAEHELVPEPGHLEHYEHYEETQQKSPVDEHHFVPESPQAESPIAAERQFMHEPEERDHEQFEDILQKSQIEEHDLVRESPQPESPIVAEHELVPEPGHLEHYEHYEVTQQESPVDEHHFVPESPQAESPIAAERQFMHEPEQRDHEQFEDILQKSQIEEHDLVRESPQPESPIVAEHELVPEPGHLEHYEHYEETQQSSPDHEQHLGRESPLAESPIATERESAHHEPDHREDYEHLEDTQHKYSDDKPHYLQEHEKSAYAEENIARPDDEMESGTTDERSFGDKLTGFAKKAGLVAGGVIAAPIALAALGAKGAYDSLKHQQEEDDNGEAEYEQRSEKTTTPVDKQLSSHAESPIVSEREFAHEPDHQEHFEHYEETEQKSPIEEQHFVKESPQAESPIVSEREFAHEPDHHEHFEETQQRSPVEEQLFVKESPQAESPIASEREFMHEPDHQEHYEHFEDTEQRSPVEEQHFVKESPQAESPIASEREFMHEPDHQEHYEHYEDTEQRSPVEEQHFVKKSPQAESPIASEREFVHEPDHQEHYEHFEDTQQRSPIEEQHFVKESPQAESPIVSEREFTHEPDHHEHFEETQQRSPIEEQLFVKESPQAESPIVSEREFMHEPDHQEHYEHYEETEQRSPVEEQHFVKESPQAESPIVSEREFTHEPDHHEHFEETQQRSPIEEQHFVKESPQAESPIVSEREFAHEPDHHEHFEEAEQRSPVEEQHFVKESPQAESPIASEREFMHEPDHQEHYEHYEETETRSPVEEQHFLKESHQAESPIASEREFMHEPDHQEHYEHYEESERRSPVGEQHFVKESPQAESPIASEREFMHEPDHHEHYEHFEETQQRSSVEEQLFVKESPQAESPIASEQEFAHEPDHQEHYEHYEEPQQRSPVEEQHFVEESPQAESPISSERELAHEPDHQEHYKHFEETQQRSSVGEVGEQHSVEESPPAESPYYEEQPKRSQEDMEEGPTDGRSFGDKLTGFAKKAGLVAGGVIAAPIALAALGAKEAYDSLKKSGGEDHQFDDKTQEEFPIIRKDSNIPEDSSQYERHESYEDSQENSDVGARLFEKEVPQAESPTVDARLYTSEDSVQEHYEHHEETHRESPVDQHHFEKEVPQAESPTVDAHVYAPEDSVQQHYEHHEETQRESPVDQHHFEKEVPQAESPVDAGVNTPEDSVQEQLEHHEETHRESPVDQHHFEKDVPQAESPTVDAHVYTPEDSVQEHYEHHEETQRESPVDQHHFEKEVPQAESPTVDAHVYAPDDSVQQHYEHHEETQRESPVDQHHFEKEVPQAESPVDAGVNTPEDSVQEQLEHHEETHRESPVDQHHFEKEVPQAESPTVDAHVYTPEDSVQEHYEHHEETQRESPADQHHFEKEVPQAESPTVDAHVYTPEDSVQEHYEHHEETQRESPVDQHHFEEEVPQAESSTVDTRAYTHEDSVQEHYEGTQEYPVDRKDATEYTETTITTVITTFEEPIDYDREEQALSPNQDAHREDRAYAPEDSVQEHQDHHEKTERETPVDQQPFGKEEPQAESPKDSAHYLEDSVQGHHEDESPTVEHHTPEDYIREHHAHSEEPHVDRGDATEYTETTITTVITTFEEPIDHQEEDQTLYSDQDAHAEYANPEQKAHPIEYTETTVTMTTTETAEAPFSVDQRASSPEIEERLPEVGDDERTRDSQLIESPDFEAFGRIADQILAESIKDLDNIRESDDEEDTSHLMERKISNADEHVGETSPLEDSQSGTEKSPSFGSKVFGFAKKAGMIAGGAVAAPVALAALGAKHTYDAIKNKGSTETGYTEVPTEEDHFAKDNESESEEEHDLQSEQYTTQEPTTHIIPSEDYGQDSQFERPISPALHVLDESRAEEHKLDTSATTQIGYAHDEHEATFGEQPHRSPSSESVTEAAHVIPSQDYEQESQFERPISPADHEDHELEQKTTEEHQVGTFKETEIGYEHDEPETTFEEQQLRSPSAESVTEATHIIQSGDYDQEAQFERPSSPVDHKEHELEEPTMGEHQLDTSAQKEIGFEHDELEATFEEQPHRSPSSESVTEAAHLIPSEDYEQESEFERPTSPADHREHELEEPTTEKRQLNTSAQREIGFEHDEHEATFEKQPHRSPSSESVTEAAHLIPSEDYEQESEFERPTSPADHREHELEEPTTEKRQLDIFAQREIGFEHNEHEAIFEEQQQSPSSESAPEAAHVIPSGDYVQESEFERPSSPADHREHKLEEPTTEEHQLNTSAQREIGFEHDEHDAIEEQQQRPPSSESATEAAHVIPSGDYEQESEFERPTSPADHREHELEEPTMKEHQLDTSAQREIGFEHDEHDAIEKQQQRPPSSGSATEAAHVIPSEDYEQESLFERPISPADHEEHELEQYITEHQVDTSKEREIGYEHHEPEATFEEQQLRSPSAESVTGATHIIQSENYDQESQFERPISPADHEEHELAHPTTEEQNFDTTSQGVIGFEHDEHDATFGEQQQQPPSSESTTKAAHVIPSENYEQESQFERPISPADHEKYELVDTTTEEPIGTPSRPELELQYNDQETADLEQVHEDSTQSIIADSQKTAGLVAGGVLAAPVVFGAYGVVELYENVSEPTKTETRSEPTTGLRVVSPSDQEEHELEQPTREEHKLDTSSQGVIGFEHDEHDATFEEQQQRPPSSESATGAAHVIPSDEYDQESQFERPISPVDHTRAEQVGAATQQELELYQREHEPTRLAETPEDSAGNKIIDFAKKAGLVAGGVLAAPVVLGAYGMKELYAAVSETSEEPKLDTAEHRNLGYEHDEHDATFEEQQQRPPSSESATEAAHVIPSEDYEQESQFERPISPADHEEHALEHPTTEEHNLDTSPQEVTGYEHDEHDATFEEQQQRPPSSESTTETAHVIPSEDYEQESQFERPISPADYEEHELEQPTTEEHKLETSSQGVIGYEHDEHDATFEEQQQRPPSSESTTEAAHVIRSEDYEQEVQFERPISPGDYEEHELAQHTTEEHKLDTSSQGEIVYEHDEHDATFEEQQQRPPSSESTTEAAHVIPSEDYEQEVQFERPISPGDYEEHEIAQHTTEEHKLDTSSQGEIVYEHDEHDATFEEQQQRPPSSESTTEAAHVIPSDNYEQESQFERPISPGDYEERELEQPTTEELKLETSAPTEIGYEQDEHDATFEEQQQRPSSSESATGAVHVITPEGYEQESQFERPISADHEEHELVETATADSKVTHTTKMADLVAGGVLVAPVVFGAYGVVALYEDVSEPARIETQSEPTTDFDNIDSAAYENVARMNLTDPEHYESSTKQSEVKLSSEDDETKNIANDSEWKVFNSKGEVVEEFSAQLAEDVITGATEETSSPQPPRKLLKQESSNEIRMEPEVDYQSDLQEKLDILATQSRNDLPILKEEEGLSIVHEEHEVEEDLPTPDTQVVNESAAKLVDDVLNAITTEEASTQPSSDFVTATEQSKDYETCVTSQTDTFQSAQQWTSQDSEYTTAPSDSTSRPDTREELVEPSTPTVLVSPIEPERPFSASDRPGIPFVFKQFDTDSKRSTPDVTLQIEGEDDELEGVLQTSASGVLQLPDMDPGRPTSPIPPRRTDSGIFIGTKQPEDTITVIQCMTPDILDATEEKINPLLRKVLPGPSETSIHDRAMEIEDTSSQYSRQISDVSSSSRADTVIQNEQYEEPIDITEELLASQIGADSIDSLDKVSMKSGGSGKRYSTSRRSSGASAKTPEREAVDFEHFGETEESVLKTEPEDVAADFEITEETPTSPDAENIEETYETFTQEEVQSLEPELETLHEEPEDSDSLNGSGSSVGAPVDTIALLGKYKHMSSDNISESSLQEFERIEQAVMNKGESSLTSSELELYLAGTAGRLIRSGEGSTNSLTEFEKLEQEVGKESPPQEDVMMLSDIREESEAEDMSVRDDEEGDNDSVSDVKIVPVNEDEERIVTPTALSNADSIEKDIDMISSVHLLETSTDSLEPTGAAVLSTQRRDSLEETSLAEYEVISKMNESMRDSLENIPHDTDSLLEGASQDVLTSQDTQGLLSGDTVGTYQEHDDDKDSLTGEMDTMLSSYPTTLTTFETTQVKDDGTVETISRRVETRVRDPVMSHVQFTGTESEERVKQLPVEEQFETVDEEGNVTRTIVKRQSPQHH